MIGLYDLSKLIRAQVSLSVHETKEKIVLQESGVKSPVEATKMTSETSKKASTKTALSPKLRKNSPVITELLDSPACASVVQQNIKAEL